MGQVYSVEIVTSDSRFISKLRNNENLLTAFRQQKNILFDAPCGGRGTCKKCRIHILSGKVTSPVDAELTALTEQELKNNIRLACLARPLSDLSFSPVHTGQAQIMQDNTDLSIPVKPDIRKRYLKVSPPTLEDQRPDVERFLSSLGNEEPSVPVHILRTLPAVLRESEYKVTVAITGNTGSSLLPMISAVEQHNTSKELYGAAIDIGTTTIAAALFDLHDGRKLRTISEMNLQKSFGGDVISRIQYSIEHEGVSELCNTITAQIERIILELASKSDIDPRKIYRTVLAGNTTMMHLFFCFNPAAIAASPFIPVSTDRTDLPWHQVRLDPLESPILPTMHVSFLPGISGYVGADITAGILASGMELGRRKELLVDIGTNGEIVLSVGKGFVACSTAAGPALEGANIECGVGGIEGAVSKVQLSNGKLCTTTINDKKPVGICGSGIVDVAALLLETGIVDSSGRMLDEDEIESAEGKKLYHRVTGKDAEKQFLLVSEEDSAHRNPVYISQKDLREVQLAKAAIAGGINTLLKTMELSADDIETLYLAGGFGNYIQIESALTIGLLPQEFAGKIVGIGNSASTGAAMCLLNEDAFSRTLDIVKRTEYVELSGSSLFQEEYVNNMGFGEL